MVALAAGGACGAFSEGDPAPAPNASDAATAPVGTVEASVDAGCDATGTCDAGREPLSLISPYRDGGLTYPYSIAWTLGALDNAIIHYTTDGTDPTASSKLASGSTTLKDLPTGTTIKWTAGDSTNVHSFVTAFDGPDGGAARNGGFIIENFRFATSTSPITSVPRGVLKVGVAADIRFWNGAGCATCIDVFTVGIDKPSDCFIGADPGLYPGVGFAGVKFTLTVPTDPGVYPIRVGSSAVFNCTQALAQPLSDVQVGTLVVTP